MLFVIIWKPYTERPTILSIRGIDGVGWNRKDFIQSSFLTEVMNNQTTAKMKSDSKTVQFEV